MQCISCHVEIDPRFVAAINQNVCPCCTGPIMDKGDKELMDDLKAVMVEMKVTGNAEGLAGWLLSNYHMQKIGSGEPTKFFNKNKRKQRDQEDEVEIDDQGEDEQPRKRQNRKRSPIDEYIEKKGLNVIGRKKEPDYARVLAEINQDPFEKPYEQEPYDEEYEEPKPRRRRTREDAEDERALSSLQVNGPITQDDLDAIAQLSFEGANSGRNPMEQYMEQDRLERLAKQESLGDNYADNKGRGGFRRAE